MISRNHPLRSMQRLIIVSLVIGLISSSSIPPAAYAASENVKAPENPKQIGKLASSLECQELISNGSFETGAEHWTIPSTEATGYVDEDRGALHLGIDRRSLIDGVQLAEKEAWSVAYQPISLPKTAKGLLLSYKERAIGVPDESGTCHITSDDCRGTFLRKHLSTQLTPFEQNNRPDDQTWMQQCHSWPITPSSWGEDLDLYLATVNDGEGDSETWISTYYDDISLLACNQQILCDAPIPQFSWQLQPLAGPTTISVTAAESLSPLSEIIDYEWNFGDGNTASGVTATHAYTGPGSYQVELHVTDRQGRSATTVQTAVLPGTAPVADFSYSMSEGPVPLTVHFDASSASDADGGIQMYEWSFGDGQRGSGQQIDHTYAGAGKYSVTLTVIDVDGFRGEAHRDIPIDSESPPVATFTAEPTTGAIPLAVTFNANGAEVPDSSVQTYYWDFGDNIQATGPTVVHTYTVAGTFTATLTVSNASGVSEISTAQITTREYFAIFAQDVAGDDVPATVNFDATESEMPADTTYAWDFGDGSAPATGLKTSHQYAMSGEFEIGLVARSAQLTRRATSRVTIYAQPALPTDTEPPFVAIIEPKHRQAAPLRQPVVSMHFTDYLGDVDVFTLAVLLSDERGEEIDITRNLTVEAESAYGRIPIELEHELSYTLTVRLADMQGNLGTVVSNFLYYPHTPPSILDSDPAGWVSGTVYDSSTCATGEERPVQCMGLPGARVTLSHVDAVVQDVDGEVITGPTGFFAFPVNKTDQYGLRVDKDGYTYGQRAAQIVRGHTTPLNEIYLTPITDDPTVCRSEACEHTNREGTIHIQIPGGAIATGDVVTVTATMLEQVQFLPSGGLPEGTWETYALNLGGDSQYEFVIPITVSISNTLGFKVGTEIPVGHWNAQAYAWEHLGTAVVVTPGDTVVYTTTHFSFDDVNFPVSIGSGGNLDGEPGDTNPPSGGPPPPTPPPDDPDECPDCGCKGNDAGNSEISIRSGQLQEEIRLPDISVLGAPYAPSLIYRSDSAAPSELIEVTLWLKDVPPNAELSTYIQIELYIEDEKTDTLTFPLTRGPDGEIGVFRYLWDGRDIQGRQLPPGSYQYALHLRMPYQTQYYSALGGIFGNPPDYSSPTGIRVNADYDTWVLGTVALEARTPNPLGVGWEVEGHQRLYEDESGRILIDDGYGQSEFYFAGKDVLRNQNATPSTVNDLLATGRGDTPSSQSASDRSSVDRFPTGEESTRGLYALARNTNHSAEFRNDFSYVSTELASKVNGLPSAAFSERAIEMPNLEVGVGTVITQSEVWTVHGDNPKFLAEDVTVNPGVTLTVEPGVVVMAEENVEITILGHLSAIGTPERPITFTSQADTGPHQWSGLVFNGGSGHLAYTTVKYGGQSGSVDGEYGNVLVRNSREQGLRIEHSSIKQGSGGAGIYGGLFEDHGVWVNDSVVVIKGSSISENGDSTNDSALFVTGSSSTVTVTHSTFDTNFGQGVVVDKGAGVWIGDTTFRNNGNYAIVVPVENLHRLQGGNAFAGEGKATRVRLRGGALEENTHLQAYPGMEAYVLFDESLPILTVPKGITLSLEPGIVLMAAAQSTNEEGYLSFAAKLVVQGHVVAPGTKEKPILLTSYDDRSDLQWSGLEVDGGTGLLRHVTFRHGGGGYAFYDANPVSSNIALRNVLAGEFRIENSTIELDEDDSIPYLHQDFGIYVENSRVAISTTLFTRNGDEFSDQSQSDYALYAEGDATELSIVDSTFSANPGYPIKLTGRNLANLRGNQYIANGADYIVVHGTTDDLPDNFTFTVEGGLRGYLFAENMTVPAGKTYHVSPGISLRFIDTNAGLIVTGTLNITGVLDEPVILTSAMDYDPGSLWWPGITVAQGGKLNARYIVVRYAWNGLQVENGALRLENSDLSQNYSGAVILDGPDTLFHAVGNTFGEDKDKYGLINMTEKEVDARYNWWGVKGPYSSKKNPEGQGSEISDGTGFPVYPRRPGEVLFEPWLQESVKELGIHKLTQADRSMLFYDGATDTYKRVYPEGSEVHFSADGTHDYTLFPSGHRLLYEYSAAGLLTSIALSLTGHVEPSWVWTIQYDQTTGHLTGITDPLGRISSFEVDEHNNLIRFTPLEDPTYQLRFAYDSAHRLIEKRDEHRQSTIYAYNEYGRVQHVVLPERAVYDVKSGAPITVSEVHTYTVSETAYQLINQLAPGDPSTPTDALVTTTSLTDSISYSGREVSGQLNSWGYWLERTDALGRTTRYQRNDANQITRIDYPDDTCVEYTYDEAGNQLSESRMGSEQCGLAPTARNPGKVQTWRYTYESRFNHRKTAIDPVGNTTTYVYDYEEKAGEAGRLVRVYYPRVRVENGVQVTPTVGYTYNELGLLETETNERNVVTRYVYSLGTLTETVPDAPTGYPVFAPNVDPMPGLLTAVIVDAGPGGLNVTTYYREHDASGNPQLVLGRGAPVSSVGTCTSSSCGASRMVRPPASGKVTRFTYDEMGRVLTEQDADGIVTKYTYDARGNLVTKILDYTPDGITGRNVVTTYGFDNRDHLVSERTAADGIVKETVNIYDIHGNLVRTQVNGVESNYSYDAADQLIGEIDALGKATTYSYSLRGMLESVVDPEGDVTRTVYDEFGREIRTVVDDGGLNLSTAYTYTLNDKLEMVTEPSGVTTYYGYDALGRRTTEILDYGGLNLTTIYTRNVTGELVATQDPRGVVTAYQIDALGRTTAMTLDPGGLDLRSEYVHDGAGNLVEVTDPRGTVTRNTYDALDRLTKSCRDAEGLNLCTAYTYDRLGNLETITDPMGIVRLTEYDAFGRLLRTVDDFGPEADHMNAETAYDYDANDNLIRIADANGNSTHYSYDAVGGQSTTIYADESTVLYDYHPDRTVKNRTDQASDVVQYSYDGANRLIRKDYPDGSYADFVYDSAGRVTVAKQEMDEHSTAMAFAFNAVGDVISSTQTIDGLAWTTYYDYDYVGSVVSMTYPSGVVVRYHSDRIGQSLDVQIDGNPLAAYSLDVKKGLIGKRLANGVSSEIEVDGLGRVMRVHTTKEERTLADYEYGYDDDGYRTSVSMAHADGKPANVYKYDRLHLLIDVWYEANATTPEDITAYAAATHYELDQLGNRLRVTTTHESIGANEAEVYLPDGMNRYQEVDGDSFRYDKKGNLITTEEASYAYDFENRQIVANRADDQQEHIYNALGFRVATAGKDGLTYYLYNAFFQILEERRESNAVAARYYYGLYIDEPLAFDRESGRIFLTHDAQYNVTEVTDHDGLLREQYEYDAYGQAYFDISTGEPVLESAYGNPFFYTGRPYVTGTQEHDFRRRMYAADLGRFLQPDPIGYRGGMNRYTNQFLVTAVDPYGEWVASVTSAIRKYWRKGLAGILVGLGAVADVLGISDRVSDIHDIPDSEYPNPPLPEPEDEVERVDDYKVPYACCCKDDCTKHSFVLTDCWSVRKWDQNLGDYKEGRTECKKVKTTPQCPAGYTVTIRVRFLYYLTPHEYMVRYTKELCDKPGVSCIYR